MGQYRTDVRGRQGLFAGELGLATFGEGGQALGVVAGGVKRAAEGFSVGEGGGERHIQGLGEGALHRAHRQRRGVANLARQGGYRFVEGWYWHHALDQTAGEGFGGVDATAAEDEFAGFARPDET